jgi:hypothetical protein
MSDENVELLRDMYGRRTLAEFAESLHPDAELHQERSIPDSADYYGRDEFVRGTALWLEEWEVFRYVPEEMVDLGDRALTRIRLSGRAKASGVALDLTAFHVWTLKACRGAARSTSTKRKPSKPPGCGSTQSRLLNRMFLWRAPWASRRYTVAHCSDGEAPPRSPGGAVKTTNRHGNIRSDALRVSPIRG